MVYIAGDSEDDDEVLGPGADNDAAEDSEASSDKLDGSEEGWDSDAEVSGSEESEDEDLV